MKHSRSLSIWKVIGALVVIFCAGQGVGYMMAPRVSAAAQSPNLSEEWTGKWVAETLSQLRGDLNLTEAQVSEIEPLLQETGEKIWRERRRALFQIHLNILDVHDGIEAHLDAGQKRSLEESREQLKNRIQRNFPEIIKNPEK